MSRMLGSKNLLQCSFFSLLVARRILGERTVLDTQRATHRTGEVQKTTLSIDGFSPVLKCATITHRNSLFLQNRIHRATFFAAMAGGAVLGQPVVFIAVGEFEESVGNENWRDTAARSKFWSDQQPTVTYGAQSGLFSQGCRIHKPT